MVDQYPRNFDIEVENERLIIQYLRIKWFLLWQIIPALLASFFGLIVARDTIVKQNFDGMLFIILYIFLCVGMGLLCSSIVSTILYFCFSHRRATRVASSLQVTVQGTFLRIIQEQIRHPEIKMYFMDRKIHFRSIVDFAIEDDILMRYFGLMALTITTTGKNTIKLIGIKDCIRVRDMLAEIDSIREQE